MDRDFSVIRVPAQVSAHEGALLEVVGVEVSFGGVAAVRGVSFSSRPGEIVGLVGPNGAGKSTLLAAIGGQQRVQRGEIRLDGRNITKLPAHARAQWGVARTFQDTSEFGGLTVFENLLVAGLGQRGASLWECTVHPSRQAESTQQACQRAWELLDRFELRALQDTYSRELSGGQRRLVEVMRCLMRDPRLMLLDEPTVGVAPALSEQLMREYKRIRAEGVCIVIVEHILDVVKEICDRVIVMDIGQVIAEGSYDEVMALPEVREAYFG